MVSNRPEWASKLLGKMKEKGVAQAQMADLIKVTVSTFSRMVNGKTASPDIDKCTTMCNSLGVTLNDIFL